MGSLKAAGFAVALFLLPAAARAGDIFVNPPAFTGGDCTFSTGCSAVHGVDGVVAQHFSLAAAATVQYASFDEYDFGVPPTSVNWSFYSDDGAGGLPGILLASGSSALLVSASLGHRNAYDVSWNLFGVTATGLSAGGYYFALQAVTPGTDNFLADGLLPSGEALSYDGGATWAYDVRPRASVAVALYDSQPRTPTPEPAAWTMMLIGVAALGAAARRRQAKLSVMAE
jgi:hypothetical protein